MNLTRLTAAACAALLLSSCADDPAPSTRETPELGDDSSVASGETPADEASPEGDELATDYPEVGLSYASLPGVEGEQRAALETYVAYERGLRELSRTAKLDPALEDLAGESVLRTLRSTVTYLRTNDVRYTGTATIDVEVDGGNDRVVVLDLCTDASELRLVTDGEERPVEGLQRAKGRVTLNTAAGTSRWLVTDYTTLEEPC